MSSPHIKTQARGGPVIPALGNTEKRRSLGLDSPAMSLNSRFSEKLSQNNKVEKKSSKTSHTNVWPSHTGTDTHTHLYMYTHTHTAIKWTCLIRVQDIIMAKLGVRGP